LVSEILFIRHGETEFNRRKERCGGDMDIPLTEAGLAQARQTGEALAAWKGHVDAVFVSPLLRTRQTAAQIAPFLGQPRQILHEGLIERKLGAWNGLPIEETEAALKRGDTPPGGEAEIDFRQRVARTLLDILERGHRMPLLVSSKGVARVTVLMLEDQTAAPLGNAALARLQVTHQAIDRLRRASADQD